MPSSAMVSHSIAVFASAVCYRVGGRLDENGTAECGLIAGGVAEHPGQRSGLFIAGQVCQL
jgi:hypothetical protein